MTTPTPTREAQLDAALCELRRLVNFDHPYKHDIHHCSHCWAVATADALLAAPAPATVIDPYRPVEGVTLFASRPDPRRKGADPMSNQEWIERMKRVAAATRLDAKYRALAMDLVAAVQDDPEWASWFIATLVQQNNPEVASPSPGEGEQTYRIKPLEWDDQPEASYARAAGFVLVAKKDGRYSTRSGNDYFGPWVDTGSSLGDAKAGAEAYYRERLSPFLTPVEKEQTR